MNYFSLIDEIKQVSLRYSEEFYEGDIYEYLNSGNHKYPCIILTVQNITTDDDVNTISATIFAVDRLTNDSSNKLEVQSLCMSKITQILGTLEERVSSIQSNTLTPFTEKFSDLCGGMYGEFTLEYIGDNLCVDEIEIKEIKLTQNGIYDIIGYDRAIVNVIPVVTLKDITITANGEYLPADYDADGFSKVTAKFDTSSLPKVKVTSFKVTNDCINEDGRWEGEDLIDTSECTAFTAPFHSCSLLVQLVASRWNTSKVREFNSVFYGCSNLVYLDVSSWNASNVTNFNGLFFDCKKLKQLDLRNWDVSNGTQFNVSFQSCNVLSSLIGGEDNSDNNISCLNGLKVNLNLSFTQLDAASLRALINGLADLTGQTTQTLTLGATLMAKLTEEDIAIAVNKNWTIV